MTRKQFLKRAAGLALGGAVVGGAYPFLEAKWCRALRVRLGVRNLPAPFVGLKVGFVADVHHGPYVPLGYVRHVVGMINDWEPDLVALGGDYIHKSRKYAGPGIAELGKLRAKLGRFAVLGNHDNWEGGVGVDPSDALAEAGIVELNNAGAWVERGGARLRVGGVGDLWTDYQDVDAAVGEATADDAVILLSHNPDYAEALTDRRVGLMLSGHTHGGQFVVPGVGAPFTSSQYGGKYREGLVRGPTCPVFVTRGAGTVVAPVRFCCRPEVVLITLAAG